MLAISKNAMTNATNLAASYITYKHQKLSYQQDEHFVSQLTELSSFFHCTVGPIQWNYKATEVLLLD